MRLCVQSSVILLGAALADEEPIVADASTGRAVIRMWMAMVMLIGTESAEAKAAPVCWRLR